MAITITTMTTAPKERDGGGDGGVGGVALVLGAETVAEVGVAAEAEATARCSGPCHPNLTTDTKKRGKRGSGGSGSEGDRGSDARTVVPDPERGCPGKITRMLSVRGRKRSLPDGSRKGKELVNKAALKSGATPPEYGIQTLMNTRLWKRRR